MYMIEFSILLIAFMILTQIILSFSKTIYLITNLKKFLPVTPKIIFLILFRILISGLIINFIVNSYLDNFTIKFTLIISILLIVYISIELIRIETFLDIVSDYILEHSSGKVNFRIFIRDFIKYDSFIIKFKIRELLAFSLISLLIYNFFTNDNLFNFIILILFSITTISKRRRN